MDRVGVGDYKFVQKIGKGCYGEVYKGMKDGDTNEYAIKLVSKESLNKSKKLVELFNTEVSVLQEINHPNILKCYEVLETSGNYYMIMKFCNGGDLDQHIKKFQRLGENESIYFMKQILNGFCELHARQIMHRDFKTANVFLHNDQIVIGDFGFAKSGVQVTTTKLGSPLNMAPEVLLGVSGATYDSRCDIWSIGIVFYNMLYGKMPWDVAVMEELKEKVRTETGKNLPMPAPPNLSKECKDVLMRMLEPNPDKRITWKDLFSHPLFIDKPAVKPAPQPTSLAETPQTPETQQSIVFKPHEASVNQLFKENQQASESQHLGGFKKLKRQITSEEAEAAVEQGLSRYFHEKKCINLIFKSSRRLIKVYVEFNPRFPKVFELFVCLAVMLNKKCSILIQQMIFSLLNPKDVYGVPKFQAFLKSPEASKILMEAINESETYNTILLKLCEELPVYLVKSAGIVDHIVKVCKDDKLTLENLQLELTMIIKELLTHLQVYLKVSGNLAVKIKEYLAYACISIQNDLYLSFVQQGKKAVFDWSEFEKTMSLPSSFDSIIEETMKKYQVQSAPPSPNPGSSSHRQSQKPS